MSAIITEGIGPESSILYVITGGYDIGTAAATTAGGHFLPLTKKEIEAARKKANAARAAEQAIWDQAAKDKAELHKQIMATLHPDEILGVGKPVETAFDDDETDIEMLLLYG